MKKIIALTLCSLFSLNAHAGYVQYNFFGSGVTGYMVQHDDDKSVAFYSIQTNTGSYFPYENGSQITGDITSAANVYQGLGPTSMYLYLHAPESSLDRAKVTFGTESLSSPGVFGFNIAIKTSQPPFEFTPYPIIPHTYDYSGFVVQGSLDAGLRSFLDDNGGYSPYINRIVPGSFLYTVPEPGTLVLLALGLTGLIFASRKERR